MALSSSSSKSNRSRIPGRCDICNLKDGKNNMTLIQCSKCNVCVHQECYMVYPQDDVNEFVCYACAAVGRTSQAVETHMSNRFYEIQQKERPVACALCSVKNGIHAMNPLFDYHGRGGRQICVKSKNGERKLVWAHSLCALYLSTVGLMYPCFKNGRYQGEGDQDQDNDCDPRPSNPALKITKEFKRMYGATAMPHFRYYMTPPNGVLDPWTKAVHVAKQKLKCIECGMVDTKYSMRIPLQCVANDPDEFSLHRKKHWERNNDISPCTQALHVGCARWGDPSSKVRKCYYFPGLTNTDGSVSKNVDTVTCLYCKSHAENVDEEYQTRVENAAASLERKKATEKDQLDDILQRKVRSNVMINQVLSSSKGRIQHASETIETRVQGSIPNTNSSLAQKKNKERERYKELHPSLAVASNAGERPTLAKRRRKLAHGTSTPTDKDVNRIFEDLTRHGNEIAQNRNSVMKGRKQYWKRKFSELSAVDFDSIWIRARNRYHKQQSSKAKPDNNKASASPGVETVNAQKYVSRKEKENVKLSKDISNDGDNDCNTYSTIYDSDGPLQKPDVDESSDGLAPTPNVLLNFDDTTIPKPDDVLPPDGNIQDRKALKKFENRHGNQRPSDRWSKLFIGQSFEMGIEFTMDRAWKKF